MSLSVMLSSDGLICLLSLPKPYLPKIWANTYATGGMCDVVRLKMSMQTRVKHWTRTMFMTTSLLLSLIFNQSNSQDTFCKVFLWWKLFLGSNYEALELQACIQNAYMFQLEMHGSWPSQFWCPHPCPIQLFKISSRVDLGLASTDRRPGGQSDGQGGLLWVQSTIIAWLPQDIPLIHQFEHATMLDAAYYFITKLTLHGDLCNSFRYSASIFKILASFSGAHYVGPCRLYKVVTFDWRKHAIFYKWTPPPSLLHKPRDT